MGGAATIVDVATVRLHGGQLELGPERLEDRRRNAMGRAVRAVESDAPSGEIHAKHGAQLADVVVEGSLEGSHPTDPLPGRLLHPRLDGEFRAVVEFRAPRVEELDP